MSFASLLFRTFVAASFATAAVGCAASEPEAEVTEASADELNAEDFFCTIFQCEGSGGSRWVKLGEESVDGLFEHDRIDVDVSTRFSKLQLRVRDGAVKVHDVEVHYRDGSSFTPELDDTYDEDSRSDAVGIPARRIEFITLDHSKTLFGTGSTVEVWAKR